MTSNKIKMSEITIDDLAVMIKIGFDEVHAKMDRKFEEIDRRFENVDKRFDQVDFKLNGLQNQLDNIYLNYVTKIELSHLNNRVTRLERKTRISHK